MRVNISIADKYIALQRITQEKAQTKASQRYMASRKTLFQQSGLQRNNNL